MQAIDARTDNPFVAHPVHAVGEIAGFHPSGRAIVHTEVDELQARKAASCLLEPVAGDRVLVSGPAPDSVWIIAVLERQGPQPSRLVFDGDVEIQAHKGDLRLKSERSLKLESTRLMLRAREGTALIDRFTWFGDKVSAALRRVAATVNLFEIFAERTTLFSKHSLRSIEEVDQVRSGVIDYQSEQTLSLRGREVLATAEELVKVDGGQIHMG